MQLPPELCPSHVTVQRPIMPSTILFDVGPMFLFYRPITLNWYII